MHTLVVFANPDPNSLTHHLVNQLTESLHPSSVEIADLAAEGFDPKFTTVDRAVYNGQADIPADIRSEHERLDRADHLVLVFPVYWWSMPALLKGWIDRVFINGWAFDYQLESGLVPKLDGLTIHFVALASGDAEGFVKHGYEASIRTQLEHGVTDYCGSKRGAFSLVYQSDASSPHEPASGLESAVEEVRSSILASIAEPQTVGAG